MRIHDIEIFYEDPIFLPKASAATKIWTAVSQQISSRPVWAKVVNTWQQYSFGQLATASTSVADPDPDPSIIKQK